MPSFIFPRTITGIFMGSRGRARNVFLTCCVLLIAFGYIHFWSGWISHIRYRLHDPPSRNKAHPNDGLDDTAEDRKDTSGGEDDNPSIEGRKVLRERHKTASGGHVIQDAEPLIQILYEKEPDIEWVPSPNSERKI